MNDNANITADTAGDERWRSLRNLVHVLCIAIFILTGTLFVFIYRQVVMVRKNTAEMGAFLNQYEDSDVPEMIERIRLKLDDYRQKDPGFTTIYIKYFGTNPPARPSRTDAGKTAPAPGSATNAAR